MRDERMRSIPLGKRIGVAVIGLGIGEQHARAYLRISECELRWLYDIDAKKAGLVSERLGAGAIASSFEQILEDSNVDLLSIASFDDAHFEQVVAALEAGKHVFVEKPLCRTIEELRVIKEAWAKHPGKLKLTSNLVLRAAPVYQWLKQKIERGDLGDIYAFDGDYLYGRLHKITQGWRKDVENYSVMQGGGVHLVDLMLWLTNQRPSSVYASGNRICSQNTDFRYNDYVAATFHFPSGLIGRITANFGCVHRHQHVMRVFGTEATFIYDDAGPRWHGTRDPAHLSSIVNLPTLPATKGDLIAPFVSAILHDENLDTHTQVMFDVISVCLACDRALQANCIEEILYV